MTIPAPSRFRTVTIYGERAPIRSRGLVGPTSRYRWASKHPFESGWWWVNAGPWCEDISDTLLAPPAKTITPADNSLSIIATTISLDGLQAGFLFSGGDPGKGFYTVTVRLIGQKTGASWAGDILLPIESAVAIAAPPSGTATMNGSVLTIGGVTIQPGQSS